MGRISTFNAVVSGRSAHALRHRCALRDVTRREDDVRTFLGEGARRLGAEATRLPLQVDARKDLGCCRFMIESRWQDFPLSGPDWNLT
jgi:hypothetical protein